MSTTTAVTTTTRRSQPGSVSSADRCQRRQRPTFESAYADACIRYKTRPSQAVKINGQTDTLTVCGDRLRVDDWRAVADALSVDLSTHHVCLANRRRTDDGPYRQYDTYRAAADAPRNVAASVTLYVVRAISAAVSDMLYSSTALVWLELDNVPFDDQSLARLVAGIKACRAVQHLSLANCRIGDGACRALCVALRNKPTVRSLNLTGCRLTQIADLVDLIKRQQYKRHEECWAHSLRYRTADPHAMHGLRRLTLNDNVDLGDEAAAELFETLKDDPFVKAIDMQNCGLTNRGAQLALSALIVNDALAVLDVRNNAQISAVMLTAVMARLYENGANSPDVGLWKWTRLNRDVTWDPLSSATFV